MKKTVFALLTLISLNAFSASVEVMEVKDSPVIMGVHDVDVDFGINVELGRAWVEVQAHRTSEDSMGDFYRARVEGLSLQNGLIVLDIEGQQVECGFVKRVGIFKTPVARMNGNCRFDVEKKKTVIDDGFNNRTQVSYVVTLETLSK
jgi:hypothetical protein